MMRLASIETVKLRRFRLFWISLTIYLAIVVLVIHSAASIKIDMDLFRITVFDHPTVWHKVSWIASHLNILLAAIVIFFVCDEYSNNTFRKQIIDGMAEHELVLAKTILIVLLAALSTLLLAVIGLVYGRFPERAELGLVFENSHFLGLHFLSLCTYLSIATLVAFIMKRAMPALMVFILLHLIEKVLIARSHIDSLALLPLNTVDDLIPMPLRVAGFGEESVIAPGVLAIFACVYFVLSNFLSWQKLKRSSF